MNGLQIETLDAIPVCLKCDPSGFLCWTRQQTRTQSGDSGWWFVASILPILLQDGQDSVVKSAGRLLVGWNISSMAGYEWVLQDDSATGPVLHKH